MTKKVMRVPAYSDRRGNTRMTPPIIPLTIAITAMAGCIMDDIYIFILNKTIDK